MAIAILTLLPAVVTFDAFWPHNFLTLRPTYTITDWQLARPIMEEYLEGTRKERGVMYCGWNVCGDKLFTSEAYHSADAVLEHIDNVQGAVSKLLNMGSASIDTVELHGPAAEVAKCKGALAEATSVQRRRGSLPLTQGAPSWCAHTRAWRVGTPTFRLRPTSR